MLMAVLMNSFDVELKLTKKSMLALKHDRALKVCKTEFNCLWFCLCGRTRFANAEQLKLIQCKQWEREYSWQAVMLKE